MIWLVTSVTLLEGYEDKDGNRRKAVEITVDSVHFCDSKKDGGQSSGSDFADPGYGGTLKGGRSIYFEAKHTDDERIEQRRLTQEQQDDLEAHHKLGAIAFVLVSVA